MKKTIEITYEFTEKEIEDWKTDFDFTSIEEFKKEYEDFFKSMYAFMKNKYSNFNIEIEEDTIVKFKVK